MRFLASRHIVVLVLAILAIEALVRMGAYEPFANPASHAGVTIKLKRAARLFGKENINVVTMGDSRAAQGLNNRMIYSAAKKFGLNHVRLSMPGSHFLTYRTLAAWSMAQLPALKGIVLAISPEDFGRLGSGAYELAEVLPIRNYTTIREMLRHVPFKRSDLRTYTPFYSIAGYRDDIRELLMSPLGRLEAVRKSREEPPADVLTFNAQEDTDICAIATSDPAACLAELKHAGPDIPERARTGLSVLCKAATRNKISSAPGSTEEMLIREWTRFLVNLSRRVRVMVVLLPDHTLFREYVYPPNANHVAHAVLSGLQRKGIIDLVDLHALIVRQAASECHFFMDARHLNKRGKEVLTRALLPELETFWRSLGVEGGSIAPRD